MPHAKLIDVVIPAYNARDTLASAIGSIQRQTVRDIGIVVVDDGSTDGSAELLAEIGAGDERVRVVTQANGGIVDALNTGLAHTDAAFIARFDADDIAFEDRLEKQLDFLRANPGHVAVGGNSWHIDSRGDRIGTYSEFIGEMEPDPDLAPSKEPYLMHPFLMVRRDAIMLVGGYRHVFHAEDTDLYWRLLELGGLYNMPDMLGEYRIHANSITGASVVNGRVSAVNSQLAAISAKRRARGDEDLVFEKPMLAALQDARHIVPMLALWAPRLTPPERRWLDIAVAAKLFELTAYRPYELEIEDARFIRGAIIRNARLLPPRNIAKLGTRGARALYRLWRTRRIREAATLMGLSR